MRKLTVMEVEAVAGGSFFSRAGAGCLGVIMGLSTGTAKGSVSGGSAGGVLGAGTVSALVGMIWGGLIGAIQGGVYGALNDWDKTVEQFNLNTEQWGDLTINTPTV